jgi:hypothetical protein
MAKGGNGIGKGKPNTDPTLSDTSTSVNENTAFSFSVAATDSDKKDILSYLLVDPSTGLGSTTFTSTDGVRFTINSATGEITTDRAFDFEVADSYVLSVEVKDRAGATDQGLVTIDVANVNETPTGSPIVSGVISVEQTTTYRPLSADDVANPDTQFFNPTNGHVYEYVNEVVSWETANSLAAQSELAGVSGHLVTITSQEEQNFVWSHAGESISVGYDGAAVWLGGSDAEQEGVWKWVTGPEAGTTFWQGAGPNGVYGPAGSPVDGNYSNWREGRYDAPNLVAGDGQLTNADYASILINDLGGSGELGTWEDDVNSYTAYGTNRPGGNAYVIEYSDPAPVSQSVEYVKLKVDTAGMSDPDGIGALSYQWETSADGVIWADVDGATEALLEVAAADANPYYRLEASYVDDGGFSESVTSSAISSADFLI